MLTDAQIQQAIEAVKDRCDELMDGYKGVSMRGALRALGYNTEDANQIIVWVAERGFEYCLDPMIEATHFDPNNPLAVNDMVTDKPSAQACVWGPDQLKSRLWSLRS